MGNHFSLIHMSDFTHCFIVWGALQYFIGRIYCNNVYREVVWVTALWIPSRYNNWIEHVGYIINNKQEHSIRIKTCNYLDRLYGNNLKLHFSLVSKAEPHLLKVMGKYLFQDQMLNTGWWFITLMSWLVNVHTATGYLNLWLYKMSTCIKKPHIQIPR